MPESSGIFYRSEINAPHLSCVATMLTRSLREIFFAKFDLLDH